MAEDNKKPEMESQNILAIYHARILPDETEKEHLYLIIPETSRVGYIISYLRDPETNRFKVEKILKRDKDDMNTESRIKGDLDQILGYINKIRTNEINDRYGFSEVIPINSQRFEKVREECEQYVEKSRGKKFSDMQIGSQKRLSEYFEEPNNLAESVNGTLEGYRNHYRARI